MSDRALARIDLEALRRNCVELKRRLGERTELCAVVKADGYGHGAPWCARAALAGGASWLAVATAEEAAELRRHGVRDRLLVMGALTREELDLALESDADLVVWREGFLHPVAESADRSGKRARVHVKLDTGMGRLGTKEVDEAQAVAEEASRRDELELAGVMTHFATADDPDSEFLAAQLDRFLPFAREVKKAHPRALAHAANSAAVFREARAHLDMARCGIAIYGLDPFHDDPAVRGLEPTLALESYVADVKRFSPGDSAGYGRSWAAERETNVAVLPIGYGDGYRRGLSNRASVLIRGRRHPIVGTISMDNTTVEVGESGVEPGDTAVLIGGEGEQRVLAEELARLLGTINYEVTCGISPRVRRLYHRGGEDA
jgi:alanine racemase